MENAIETAVEDAELLEDRSAGGKALKLYVGFWAVALTLVTAVYAYVASVNRQSLDDTGFGGTILPLIEIAVLGFFYLIPAFVADKRGHRDVRAIALANIVFGWTLLGWFVTLIWAMSPSRGVKAVAVEAQQQVRRHPLVRDAAREVDRAFGGKLRTYIPPAEGMETLIDNWGIAHDIDGSIHLRARLLLPMGTKVKLSLRPAEATETCLSATYALDSGGVLFPPPLLRLGRPLPAGPFVFRIETLPFEYGLQEDWIVDAVGERGKSLPHSATKPSDPEFPQHGRYVCDEVNSELPPLQWQTGYIERIKLAASPTNPKRLVEEILRDRLASHPDEHLVDAPWTVEQSDQDRWIVGLRFRRRGRPVLARWEVNSGDGTVRYIDPDAKALSLG